jgi:hypothetical protein
MAASAASLPRCHCSRVEFDVDVYEKAPQLNEVSGDIRDGVP